MPIVNKQVDISVYNYMTNSTYFQMQTILRGHKKWRTQNNLTISSVATLLKLLIENNNFRMNV